MMLINKIKDFGVKKLVLIVLLILIIIIAGTMIIKKVNSDGMENNGITNVYYRTYTKENGWSKWSKNGKTSGNQKDNILNIEIKLKKKETSKIVYRVYNTKNDWSDEYTIDSKMKNQSINAIKLATSASVYRKSNICYRTYNDEDKWLEWTCDGEISGNKEKEIKALEIKIIPKNVIQKDYLKDFEKTTNNSNVGF